MFRWDELGSAVGGDAHDLVAEAEEAFGGKEELRDRPGCTRVDLGAQGVDLLRGLGELEVEPPTSDEWDRIAELVDEYADLPLGGTDASVVALAERLDASVVITLDRRHFTVVRTRDGKALDLLPAA